MSLRQLLKKDPTHFLVKYVEDNKIQVRSRAFIKSEEVINVSAMYEVQWGRADQVSTALILGAGSETEMKTMQKTRPTSTEHQEPTPAATISTKKRPAEKKLTQQPKKKLATVISRSKSPDIYQPYLATPLETSVSPWDSPISPNIETNTIHPLLNTPTDFYLRPDPTSTYTTLTTTSYTDLLNDDPPIPQTATTPSGPDDFLQLPNMSQRRVALSTDRKLDALNKRLSAVEKNQAEMKTMLQRIFQLLQQKDQSETMPPREPMPSREQMPSRPPMPSRPVVAEDLTHSHQPFSDIPDAHRIPLHELEKMKGSSFSQGHFGCAIVKYLYPELFTEDNLRLQYSYFGGGKLSKKELDKQKKNYLTRYILYFYPDCQDRVKFQALIVSSINEMLRRPVRLQHRQ